MDRSWAGVKRNCKRPPNRFLSFSAGDWAWEPVFRVKFVSLPGDYSQFNGRGMWVGGPFLVTESPARTDPGQAGLADFWAAKLQCEKPVPIRWWPTLTGDCHQGVCWGSRNAGITCADDSDCFPAVIHVYGEFIVPDGQYEVRELEGMCLSQWELCINNDSIAPPLPLETSSWGDTNSLFVNGQWSAPDGQCLVPTDVMAVLSKVALGPLSKTRADVIGDLEEKSGQPDLIVDLTKDVIRVLSACGGRPFPAAESPTGPCP